MVPDFGVQPCKVVMWGAGDQGRINRPLIEQNGGKIVAFIDDTQGLQIPLPSIPVFCGWDAFQPWLQRQNTGELGFVIAIGNPFGDVRISLHNRFVDAGLSPFSFADRTAYVSDGAVLGPGVQLMPQALVHVDAKVGKQCIINTGAIVEHDCVLGDGVEIAPGAILCGRVIVGNNTWICAGATVLPRIRIGANVIVGAGALVNCDVPDGSTIVGVPARPIKGEKS